MWHLILGVKLQLQSPSRDKVSKIDHVLYPIGSCNPFLSPLGQSNLVFPLESNITICETPSTGICVLSSPSFMDFEFSSDKVILEAMIMDLRPPPELEDL
jgi:hypothetical protein